MYRYMQSTNVWRKSYTVKVRKVQKLNCVPMFMAADLCLRETNRCASINIDRDTCLPATN